MERGRSEMGDGRNGRWEKWEMGDGERNKRMRGGEKGGCEEVAG